MYLPIFLGICLSLKVICDLNELLVKSQAIQSMKFSGDIYDGGQNAKLNQEFAMQYSKSYLINTIMRVVLAAIFLPIIYMYDWTKDPWKSESIHDKEQLDRKFNMIKLFTLIYASIQVTLTLIQCIVIRAWSKKRVNFVELKKKNSLLEYDDNILKRYLTPSVINNLVNNEDDINASTITSGQN